MNKESVKTITQYILALLTIVAYIVFVYTKQSSTLNFDFYKNASGFIFEGFLNTILISTLVLIFSLITGFIFYLFKTSKVKYLNAIALFIQEIMYGTPLLVFIIITYYVVGPAFFDVRNDINNVLPFVFGIISLVFYMTPYIMSVFESAISSISEEQYLTIEAFGFSSYQKYRYIIIPQVLRILMPPMMNNFSLIVKGSALLHLISYQELFFSIKVIQDTTYAYIEGILIMWVLYLIITIPLSRLSKYIERKWSN